MVNSDSIWKKLVLDAERRECFHNADEDNNLAQAIVAALLELGQLHSLLNIDSFLFKNARWKVDAATCPFNSNVFLFYTKQCQSLKQVFCYS